MNKKIVLLGVSCLMVAALLLASCAPTVVEEEEEGKAVVGKVTEEEVEEEEEEEEDVVVGRKPPFYGGTITCNLDESPAGFDDCLSGVWTTKSLHLTNETLITGDWSKGLAGTGETDWFLGSFFNIDLETGCIAESWEVPDPNTMTFHIRSGIYWHNKPPTNGRELTAEDVAFSIRRWFEAPTSYMKYAYSGWFDSVEVTDGNTVVIHGNDSAAQRTATAFSAIADFQKIWPEDAIEYYGDMADWRDNIGSGPFLLTDYVTGSSLTLERNPNYWRSDPVHPENKLPYVDRALFLIIPDRSTRLAALRTGQLDWLWFMPKEDFGSVITTCPELEWAKGTGYTWGLHMRTDLEPFNDLSVRRALEMAIDNESIKREIFGDDAAILAYPVLPGPTWQDIRYEVEDLPEDTRKLFEYHPEEAKQLLTTAGYPDGFTATVVCGSADVDMLSLVKGMWEKIDVTLNIAPQESGVLASMRMARDYEGFFYTYLTTNVPYKFVNHVPDATANISYVDDPYITERRGELWEWEMMANQAERARLCKEGVLRILEQVYEIQMPTQYQYRAWWPWVKNYHGEDGVGYHCYSTNHVIYLCIDEELKESMGY